VKVTYEPDGKGFGSAKVVRLDAPNGSVYHTLSVFARMDFTEFEREARIESIQYLESRYPFFSRKFITAHQKNLVTRAVEPFAPRVLQVLSKSTQGNRTRVIADSALWKPENPAYEFSTRWSYLLIEQNGVWRIDDVQYQVI
jgi:hypothetical protein